MVTVRTRAVQPMAVTDVNIAWSVAPSAVLVSLLEAKQQAAYAAAVEAAAEAAEEDAAPPEAPVAVADPVDAALALLEDEEIKAAAAGASLAEDFEAVSTQLGVSPPHKGLLKAMQGIVEGRLAIRGWQCDLPSLTALVTVLAAHAEVTAVGFWQCALDEPSLTLLERALPSSVETLAVEGAPVGELVSSLATIPTLTSLSLRCASLTAMPPPLSDALRANETLTCLSFFGNPLGDAGAIELLDALRAHPALLTLNLGRAGLTDATAQAVLDVVSDPDADEAAEAEAEPAAEDEVPEEVSMGLALNVAILPNRVPVTAPRTHPNPSMLATAPNPSESMHRRSRLPPERQPADDQPADDQLPSLCSCCSQVLTALNLSYNSLGTAGKLALEAAQVASPGLARIELVGNPCLKCGPAASLGAPAREAIKSTWAAVAELEGGHEAFGRKVAAAALGLVPEALPLVGYVPPVAAAEEAEAESKEEAAAPNLEEWEGLEKVGSLVAKWTQSLVASLDHPAELHQMLRYEMGIVCASRGLPAGRPFEIFGEALLAALAEALGDGLGEEAALAWKDAYADGSRCMQTAYTPAQVAAAEAAAKAAADAAAADAEEGA